MKKTINILLSFFMSVIIFVFGVCLTAAFITSAPFIKGVVAVSGYVGKVETELSDTLESVAIPSGLPQSFFEDKIHTDFIKETINNSITAAIKGENYEMPKSKIEELVYNDILKYANENGIQMDEEAETMLKNTAELTGTYYKNYTYNIFYRVLKYLKGVSIKMFVASLVLLAVLAFMLYLLKGKKELCYALLAGGAMLITPIIFVVTGAAFKWAIVSEALLTFINLFIGISITLMVVLGAVSLIVGIKNTKKFLKDK